MRAVVDGDVLVADWQLIAEDLTKIRLEEAIGELRDIFFCGATDPLASLGRGRLEGQPDDLLADYKADDLQAFCHRRDLYVLVAGI